MALQRDHCMHPCLPASGTSHLLSAMRKGKQAHSGPSRDAGKMAPTVHATNRCQSACCAKAPSKLQMLLMPYPKSHMRGHDSCNDVFETSVQMRKDSEACFIFAEHQSLTWNMLFSLLTPSPATQTHFPLISALSSGQRW